MTRQAEPDVEFLLQKLLRTVRDLDDRKRARALLEVMLVALTGK